MSLEPTAPVDVSITQVQDAVRQLGVTDLDDVIEVRITPTYVKVKRRVRDDYGQILGVGEDLLTESTTIHVRGEHEEKPRA